MEADTLCIAGALRPLGFATMRSLRMIIIPVAGLLVLVGLVACSEDDVAGVGPTAVAPMSARSRGPATPSPARGVSS